MAKQPTRKVGRPNGYSLELAEAVCEAIALSDYGLEQICEREDFPSAMTIYRWLREREEFQKLYARAREIQGHFQQERAVKTAIEAQDAQLGRLAYDARKWAAAKLNPRVYGDKVVNEVTGPDGQPLTSAPQVVIFQLPDNERSA